MKLKLLQYQLESKGIFRIAHGARTHTDSLIISIEKDGIVGLGEATHVPYYGIDISNSIQEIKEIWAELSPFFGRDPENFWRKANNLLGSNNFAKCALDIAHYDWLSKNAGLPLWKYLGLTLDNIPASSFTILIDEPKVMGEAILQSDFPVFKIKLGTENDMNTMQYLRSITKQPFVVDINGAWASNTAQSMATELESLGVQFIEQPFPKDAYKDSKELKKKVNIPIFADESIVNMSDMEKCKESFDGLNFKLGKCGGIYPSLLMIAEARKHGLQVMMGCSTESSIGISTIAHMASLLDFLDMDGALMIKNNPAEGINLEKGLPIFNNRNGHGAFLKNGII